MKRLRVVVRYASEMNDTSISGGKQSNLYAGDPDGFKASFQDVRQIFDQTAPGVAFAFSPAIRRDLTEPNLHDYWPGDDAVDIISCTWYLGDTSQFNGAAAFFTAYVLHREGVGKPFAIDEMGGCQTVPLPGDQETGKDNDATLKRMSGVLQKLKQDGITFSYVTVFLNSKWGIDPTLDWV
jgi:hypothetical protein